MRVNKFNDFTIVTDGTNQEYIIKYGNLERRISFFNNLIGFTEIENMVDEMKAEIISNMRNEKLNKIIKC
jgi:hypothetical protein